MSMSVSVRTTFVAVVALAVALSTDRLGAQDTKPGAHGQHQPPAAHGQARQGAPGGPDAGRHGHLVSAEACEADFEKTVAAGRGFGMAFTADRNGYPGPLHVLELAQRLGLTAEQGAKVRALMQAMYDESRPKGARLLEAERRLQRLFERGAVDEAGVRAALAEVERARAEVRLVHLLTHVKARDLLTPEQRAIYRAERWGAR